MYNKARGLWFSAPETGSSGGGGAASGDGTGNGGGGQGGGGDTIKTPFDDLPWDELPEADRGKLEKAKVDFIATLQKSTKLETDLQKTTADARKFQSEKDRAEAELKRWKPREQDADDPYLTAITEELAGAGYNPADASKMAPVFAGMFKRIGVLSRKEIAHDLGPVVGTVIAQEAQNAFQAAYGQDPIGMLQVPEVAQAAWDHVKARVERGEQTDSAIVLNLAKMAYVDYVADKRSKGEEIPAMGSSALPSTPPLPGMRTGMSYPGAANVHSIAPRPADPNAAKHVLNDDTRNALASTFKQMAPDLDILPKAFQTTGGKRK